MAKTFVQHLQGYYRDPAYKPMLLTRENFEKAETKDPRDASKQLVLKATHLKGAHHLGLLTRVFNDFPHSLEDEKERQNCFPADEEVKANEELIKSINLEEKHEDDDKGNTPEKQKGYCEKYIRNHKEIASYIHLQVKEYLSQIFNYDQDEINLKPEIAKLLGISEDLYDKYGKHKVLENIYSSFMNAFLFHLSDEFRKEVGRDAALTKKNLAFTIYSNVLAEESIKQFFSSFQKSFSERVYADFDDVFNHEKKYSSRRKAFFGLKAPYFTLLIDIPLNIVKVFTEFLPAVTQSVGQHFYDWADKRLKQLPDERTTGWWKTPCAYAGKYFVGPVLIASGFLIKEVGKTFTSPVRAAKETYQWVKQKTGGGILGTLLGGLAALVRLAPVALILCTVGLPAMPVVAAKFGGGYLASAASYIKYGLGFIAKGITGHGVAAATTVANTVAQTTFVSTFTPIVSAAIGINYVAQAASAFFKGVWSGLKSIYNRCKPKNKDDADGCAYSPPQEERPAPAYVPPPYVGAGTSFIQHRTAGPVSAAAAGAVVASAGQDSKLTGAPGFGQRAALIDPSAAIDVPHGSAAAASAIRKRGGFGSPDNTVVRADVGPRDAGFGSMSSTPASSVPSSSAGSPLLGAAHSTSEESGADSDPTTRPPSIGSVVDVDPLRGPSRPASP